MLEHDIEQRQHAFVQTGAAQLMQTRQGIAGGQQFEHFIEQPCLGDIADQGRQLEHRGPGGGLDFKTEFGGKAGRAQHPDRVFAVAGGRVADHADDFCLHVGYAVMKIEHFVGNRIVIERIDREVTPGSIFGVRTPDVVAQHAAVIIGLGVGLRRAKG